MHASADSNAEAVVVSSCPSCGPLARTDKSLRLRECLDRPLILMTPDTELRAMVDQIDLREHRAARPLMGTSSVAMVRRLVAGGTGFGFLISGNVVAKVAQGQIIWIGLADAGSRSFSCLYQSSEQTTSVAMGMFLQLLETAPMAIVQRFDIADPEPRCDGFAI